MDVARRFTKLELEKVILKFHSKLNLTNLKIIINFLIFQFFSTDGSESGLKDDENEASVATLQSLAATLEADCVLLRRNRVDHGVTGQYLVRKRLDRDDFLEIRYYIFLYKNK